MAVSGACGRGRWQHFGLLWLPDEPGRLNDRGSCVPWSVTPVVQRPRQRGIFSVFKARSLPDREMKMFSGWTRVRHAGT